MDSTYHSAFAVEESRSDRLALLWELAEMIPKAIRGQSAILHDAVRAHEALSEELDEILA